MGAIINSMLINDMKVNLTRNVLGHKDTYMIMLLIFLLIWFAMFVIWLKKRDKNMGKILGGDPKDVGLETNLESVHFLTDSEMDEMFQKGNYKELNDMEISGVPIKAEEVKEELKVYFADNTHTMVIGTTGSGKTSSFISPSIEILSNTKGKPSMFIADPKGELFRKHASSLKSKGYKIKVIDLRNPYASIRWNPLERIWDMNKKKKNIREDVILKEEYGYYELYGEKYYSKETLEEAILAIKQKFEDSIYEDLHDIVIGLCPIHTEKDPLWEKGAQNLIFAIAMAMLEDTDTVGCEMCKEKYNFYNIMKIATTTQGNCKELKKYFKDRDVMSKSITLSTQVLDAPEKTRESYMSSVQNALSLFSDLSLCALTSKDDTNFKEMADYPTAYFLQIPDEKETRHPLASLIVLHAYKELVSRANLEKDLSLPRNVYFLLDEFGNLPKIPKIEQMITVGRSRKIWFVIVLQSYAQLDMVYGNTAGHIIRSNCNIHVFIGTTDTSTIEEFSKKCGNYGVVRASISNIENENNRSVSVDVKERPLIYPSELQKLNKPGDMGNAIVSIFGFNPIRSRFTPYYLAKSYIKGEAVVKKRAEKPFIEKDIFYNFTNKNLMEMKYMEEKRRKEGKHEELRKTIKDYLTKMFLEQWDGYLLERYYRARSIKSEYEIICEMKQEHFVTGDKEDLFSQALNRAVLRYEKDMGMNGGNIIDKNEGKK
ncbi:MAG: type IV secretory system conjugative DNA transfer family protein [Clostridia bacterium]|nr:type IV secretory system conjugative DNA transfer family protein [Clostridia bacterium]